MRNFKKILLMILILCSLFTPSAFAADSPAGKADIIFFINPVPPYEAKPGGTPDPSIREDNTYNYPISLMTEEEYKNVIKHNILSLANEAKDKNLDARFAVVSFLDSTVDKSNGILNFVNSLGSNVCPASHPADVTYYEAGDPYYYFGNERCKPRAEPDSTKIHTFKGDIWTDNINELENAINKISFVQYQGNCHVERGYDPRGNYDPEDPWQAWDFNYHGYDVKDWKSDVAACRKNSSPEYKATPTEAIASVIFERAKTKATIPFPEYDNPTWEYFGEYSGEFIVPDPDTDLPKLSIAFREGASRFAFIISNVEAKNKSDYSGVSMFEPQPYTCYSCKWGERIYGILYPWNQEERCDQYYFNDREPKNLTCWTPQAYNTKDLYNRIPEMDYLGNALKQHSIYTAVVSKNSFKKHYTPLYTPGDIENNLFFIDINSKDYYQQMTKVLEFAIDTDGDGLPDIWEKEGVDIDFDGTVDVDLPAMGADPAVPDIFVEVDYMLKPDEDPRADLPAGRIGKNFRPPQSVLNLVKHAFAKPQNPRFLKGINLHIDAGSDTIMNLKTGAKWENLSKSNSLPYQGILELGENYEKWSEIAEQHFPKERWNIFRYCIFVNEYTINGVPKGTGLANDIPGQYFIVSDPNVQYDYQLAGTFMHELGHTLGLGHGGNDHINYKPNYLSVMNYLFQRNFNVAGQLVNYSEWELPPIDQKAVDENKGIDPGGLTSTGNIAIDKDSTTNWKLARDRYKVLSSKFIASTPINFDQNKDNDGKDILETKPIWFYMEDSATDQQISRDSVVPSSANDWDRIIFKGGAIGDLGMDRISISRDKSNPMIEEITWEEAKQLNLIYGPDDCQVNFIAPTTVYAGYGNQELKIGIENMFDKPTTVVVEVSSDLLPDTHAGTGKVVQTIDLVGREEKEITIPIPSVVSEGTHIVTVNLLCANGNMATRTMKIYTFMGQPIVIKTGDSYTMPVSNDDSLNSDNTKVAIISGRQIVGVGEGRTFIVLRNSVGDAEAYVPIYVTSDGSNPLLGSGPNPPGPNVETFSITFTPPAIAEAGSDIYISYQAFFGSTPLTHADLQVQAWLTPLGSSTEEPLDAILDTGTATASLRLAAVGDDGTGRIVVHPTQPGSVRIKVTGTKNGQSDSAEFFFNAVGNSASDILVTLQVPRYAYVGDMVSLPYTATLGGVALDQSDLTVQGSLNGDPLSVTFGDAGNVRFIATATGYANVKLTASKNARHGEASVTVAIINRANDPSAMPDQTENTVGHTPAPDSSTETGNDGHSGGCNTHLGTLVPLIALLVLFGLIVKKWALLK